MIRACASTNNKNYKSNLFELATLGFLSFKRKKVNTSISDYGWLPLRFDKNRPFLRCYDKWSIADFESKEE